ncbi:hypothetical protein Micbo1qcDRAFT_235129 [Microdochium bolleyi]|uniref:Uncharacterized protein n=1 Tax=Microdochium bolleyi TaxID=196109 RepID=A0A136IYI2_9PEZI|nr:hypothetical protein Micbo1qcDRAFT_235129 [Microdochium bolleyi]
MASPCYIPAHFKQYTSFIPEATGGSAQGRPTVLLSRCYQPPSPPPGRSRLARAPWLVVRQSSPYKVTILTHRYKCTGVLRPFVDGWVAYDLFVAEMYSAAWAAWEPGAKEALEEIAFCIAYYFRPSQDTAEVLAEYDIHPVPGLQDLIFPRRLAALARYVEILSAMPVFKCEAEGAPVPTGCCNAGKGQAEAQDCAARLVDLHKGRLGVSRFDEMRSSRTTT